VKMLPHAATVTGMETAASVVMGRAGASGSGAADPMMAGDDTAVHAYVKAHIPTPHLPSLPAKLLMWHVIRTAYTEVNRTSRAYFWPSQVGSLVFAALPLLVRAAAGAFRRVQYSPAGITALAVLVFLLFYMVGGRREWGRGEHLHVPSSLPCAPRSSTPPVGL